jgi:ABC-type transporter Mla maintaining outer membrane lipid asymmetry ATPase subunit MlaF
MRPTSRRSKFSARDHHHERARARAHPAALRDAFPIGALLASLTVGENVALPLLEHTKLKADEIEEIVMQTWRLWG